MTSGRKYRKPPVVEALCEIYFAGSNWDETVPGGFYDRVKDNFPVKRQREIQEAQVAFAGSGEAAASVRRLPPWMQFLSEKGDRLIQLARDLLVVNQLQPYPSFEDWEPVIYSALDVYRDLAQPKGVARLGMRYINRVVIPEPVILMEDYFTVYPHLPRAMGEEHGRFMVRFEVPAPKRGHSVLVTFGSAPSHESNEIVHMLDLYDIFKPVDMLPLDQIPMEVQTAHENVEAAFEGSITERLRQLFDLEETR